MNILYLILPLIGAYQADFIKLILQIIVRKFFHNITVSNIHLLRSIDKYLIDTSNNNIVNHGNNKSPMNTWHYRWYHGPLLFIRSSKSEMDDHMNRYSIYGTCGNIDVFLKMIENKDTIDQPKGGCYDDKITDKRLEVAYFDAPTIYGHYFTRRRINPPHRIPFNGQLGVTSIISKEYMSRINQSPDIQPRKRVGALLLGSYGVGKSDTAKFISMELQKYGVQSLIIYGYDMTSPGINMDNVWDIQMSKDRPVIIVFDEFDKACEFAEQNVPHPKGYRALAQNKTTLDNLLDRLESEPYIITIFTSNMDFEYFKDKHPSYVRNGRIDFIFTMTRDDYRIQII